MDSSFLSPASSTRGYDPRDEDNFFSGMVAFVSLYNKALLPAEIELIHVELPVYRAGFNSNNSAADTPSATVSSVDDFLAAVNNANVVNFTFASGQTFDTQMWYIYRPDKDVYIDGLVETPVLRRGLLQNPADPNSWPLISAPSNSRVMRVDAGNVTIKNVRFRGNGTVQQVDSTGGQGGCLLFGTTGAVYMENVQFEVSSMLPSFHPFTPAVLSLEAACGVCGPGGPLVYAPFCRHALVPQNCRGVGNGGAINANSKITCVNCRFINCSSGNSGGALYSYDVLSLVGSSFVNSTAGSGVSGSGGAVFAVKNATVSTTTFSGSSAATGGAIYAAGDISVSGSSFDSSTARSGGGGAIYAVATASVQVATSAFSGSFAASSGGSVAGGDFMVITGSNFTSSASNGLGGAIFGGMNITVQGSRFTFCSSRQSGGGVYALDYASFSSSVFSYSSAVVSGGGAYAGVFATVSASTFLNTSSGNSGGALFASDNLTVTNSAFVGSAATQGSGGGIYGTSMVLTGTNFSGTASQGPGGGVYVARKSCLVSRCAFSSTTANQDGGGIFVETGGSIAVSLSQFTGCSTTTGNGGAVAATLPTQPVAAPPVFLTVDSSTFTLNTAPLGTGGAISSSIVLLTYSTFNNNSALNGGGVGMTTFFSYLQDFSNTFSYNAARLAGGAVYAPCWTCSLGQASVMSSSSTYRGNVADGLTPHGGAVAAFRSTVSIQNCTFTSNRATFLSSASVNDQIPSTTFGQLSGGALFLYSPVALVVNGSTFERNTATDGGAATVTGDGTGGVVTFANSTFLFNSASGTNGGGALQCELIRMALVLSSTFTGNSAPQGLGGAVHLDNISSVALVDDGRFFGNTADSAGAVFFTTIPGTPALTNAAASGNRRAALRCAEQSAVVCVSALFAPHSL